MPNEGDEVLHEQLIDVALYDQDGTERIFSNIILQAENYTYDVITGLEIKPAAILVNANNKGYCRVVFEKESLHYFLEHLNLIESDLNRTYIWRTLTDNMKI